MKKTKRGAKQFFVAMLAIMLVMESVSVPVKGEMKGSAEAQEDMISGQTLSESVENDTEQSVSANFVSTDETEVSASAVKKEEIIEADEVDAEKTAGEYSGIDGDLEWSIDAEGCLTVSGQGDYEKTPDWLQYKKEIKNANINVQKITSMKDFFKECFYLEEVSFEGTDASQVTDMSGMFYRCTELKSVNMKGIDTAKVTTMKNMFGGCQNIENIGMDGINTGCVTDMSGMFSSCKNLKEIDISMFDMAQVTNLHGLFVGCEGLEQVSLGKPDTSQVESMSAMFSGCKALEMLDVSELDTENVKQMASMFAECEKLTELDLNTFDFTNVGNTQKMFYNCSELETIKFGESEMKNLSYTPEMFSGCSKLQSLDLSTLHTTNVTDMRAMFMGCQSLEVLNVSHFDTANVQNMSQLFYYCSSIEQLDITDFDTTNVKDMSWMFQGCSSLKGLDISEMNTSNVTDMRGMFAECKSIEKLDISTFDTAKVTWMSSMFYKCSALLELELGEPDVSEVLNMDSMFAECKSLKSLDVSDFNCGKTTVMSEMFRGCSGLEELKVWGMNTISVKRMDGMFRGCSSLVNLTPISYTGSVTNMSWMFEGCSSLTYLNVSDFSVQNVTTMSYMFSNCANLKTIRVYGFYSSKLEDMSGMFSGCSGLEKVDLIDFDMTNVTSVGRMFYGCKSLTDIDVSDFKSSKIYSTTMMFAECDKLISVRINPDFMRKLLLSISRCFEGSELFSEFHVSGTNSEWEEIRYLWQNCPEKKVKYASVHLNDGTIEQTLQHEGSFQYIKQGGFGTQDPADYVYNCDLSQFFGSGYNYNHNLGQMSIRVAMAAMSDNTHVNSSNIEALMDDLNLSKKKINYPKPEYNSIGYAMGTRRIYHNNQKKTLIMVAIRGGGYGAEWGGNANVGAGGEHEGFALAATQVYDALSEYIAELRTCGFIGKDDKEIAVWISGYSRGAATANLLAAKLDDQYYMSTMLPEFQTADVKSENVFAFCFECPRNTVNQYHDNSRYQNIFNIINPKDFVTYVAMNNGLDWRFNRYGKDLVLPDEANTKGSDYAGYYASMKNVYQAGIVPEIGVNQSILVKDISKQFANLISKEEYVWWHQEQVQPILVSIMSKQLDFLSFYKEYIKLLVNYNHTLLMVAKPQFDILLADIAFVNKGIMHAHYPDLCMAWMDSIPEEVLTKKKSFWNVFVNCPVDIYIYENENLVGCIKNDAPQQIENGVSTMLDNNGQKQVVLPGDGEYRVVYKATGDGTMTISTSKYMQTEVIPESVTGYYELPLKTGEIYESLITTSNFELCNPEMTVIEPSVIQTGSDVQMYKVDVKLEGNGEASGINTYSVGEFAKVSAHPNDGEQFLGWYENETLISSEMEYRFCVKKDTTFIAKFTQNDKNEDVPDDEEKDEKVYKVDIVVEGNGEVTGANTYPEGESVKVFAYPNEGGQFLGWYENETLISSETEYSFIVEKDIILTAKFAQIDKTDEMPDNPETEEKRYKVAIIVEGDGEVTGANTYSEGESVKVSAYPNEGGQFLGWYENETLISSETEYSFIVEKDIILTAKFAQIDKTDETPDNPETDEKRYKVDIIVEGNGEVNGANMYSEGASAKVSAHPDDGEQFLGWYENELLISSETEYRFCVMEDTTFTAKFTQNVKASEKEEQSVAIGKIYKVNKHIYKVTNVEKKTVSFVKTSSKSKTIKIPATVTINGTRYKVTAIAANALKGNKKITKVVIGKNVTSIGKKAFYKCASLKKITLPAKVKTIGESAFSGCKKLSKVTIGKGVTKIGKKAFYNCKKLKAVTIKAAKLKSVGKYAFKGIEKQAIIKCPAKKVKKYKKMLQKSKIAKTVQVK